MWWVSGLDFIVVKGAREKLCRCKGGMGHVRSCWEGGISVAANISCCKSCTVAFVKSTWSVVTPLGWRSRTGAILVVSTVCGQRRCRRD